MPKSKIIYVVVVLFIISSYQLLWADETEPSNNETASAQSPIERGKPNFIIDSIGNVISIPSKLILLNPKVDNHRISKETEEAILKYIQENPKKMDGTKVRLNQFALIGDLKRLTTNKKVSWWWRVFPGIPVTVLSSGGRLFGGDHYNPYTDTINIYSDLSSVALHEAGHAADFSDHAKKGTAGLYAVGRILVPVTLHQEYAASEEAISHLKKSRDRKHEKEAYKTLYPAYGTYVGGATGIPFANVAGAAVGHVVGIIPRKDREKAFEAYDKAIWSDEIVVSLTTDPVSRSLLDEYEHNNNLLDQAFLSEMNKSEIIQHGPDTE